MSKVIKREKMPYRPCVGTVVFNAEGKVWAGRRIPDSESEGFPSHQWQFPQGGIDKDEDPLPAARRELFEETGITTVSLLGEASSWFNYELPDDKLGIALKGKYRGQTQMWFAFRFEGEESEINISHPPDGSKPEFDAWEWKTLSEMPDLIVPFKRQIYLQIAKEFSSLASQ